MKNFGIGLCVLGCILGVGCLIFLNPLGSLLPIASMSLMLFLRQSDLKGATLFIAFQCLAGTLIYIISFFLLGLIHINQQKFPYFFATLIVFAELRLFLNVEFGDGQLGRSKIFLALAATLAILEFYILI